MAAAAEEMAGLVGDAEPKESLLLRMDINEIVNKGLAMRERGEKFFEAGNREVPAYQRMIVRSAPPDPRPPTSCVLKVRRQHDAGRHACTPTRRTRSLRLLPGAGSVASRSAALWSVVEGRC